MVLSWDLACHGEMGWREMVWRLFSRKGLRSGTRSVEYGEEGSWNGRSPTSLMIRIPPPLSLNVQKTGNYKCLDFLARSFIILITRI